MARPGDALFRDGKPVPVAEVRAMVDDDSTATRIDGPQPRSSGWQKARDRKIKGKRFRPSHLQWMKCVACFKPLWDLALQLEAIIEATAHGRAGRRREYKVIDALLFEIHGLELRHLPASERQLRRRGLLAHIHASSRSRLPG